MINFSLKKASILIVDDKTSKFELLCEVSEDILIESDQDVLETIIRNIILNAVKFVPTLGKVTVKAQIKNNEIQISISDSGVGIPKNVQKNLFRIDSKLQSQNGTAGEKGSGLGLILCKEFIDKLGGTITVDSEEGKGTIFTLCLPNQLDLMIC